MSFPEEPLDQPPAEGGGYYPAHLRQKLDKGRYEIVRKLGYGPRSSTWLVWDEHALGYSTVKIYTVAASEHAEKVEIPILTKIRDMNTSTMSSFACSFWETSIHGSHLCIETNTMTSSVKTSLLPLLTKMRRIISVVAEVILCLHAEAIMHGAIKTENVFFWTSDDPEVLDPILDSEPQPTSTIIKTFSAIQSQPIPHHYKWNNKDPIVADWPLEVISFGHAQQRDYKPDKNRDYNSAPETLLKNPTCSPQTDIWMLGYMAFTLLTGSSPFQTVEGTSSHRIAAMAAILGDKVPPGWSGFIEGEDYDAGVVTSIEARLAKVLYKSEARPATSFIKGCLRLDPSQRLTGKEAFNHPWLDYVF